MNCATFIDQVNQWLDERQDPLSDSEIVSHISVCDDCREELTLYRAIHTNLPPAYELSTEDSAINAIESVVDRAVAEPESSDQFVSLNSSVSESIVDTSSKSSNRPAIPRNRKLVSYVALATTAAAILLLLTPFGALPFGDSPFNDGDSAKSVASNQTSNHPPQVVNSADDDNGHFSGKKEPTELVDAQPTNRNRSDRQAVKGLEELQKVGESINSVWTSIQEDEYLLPIIGQGALIFVHGA